MLPNHSNESLNIGNKINQFFRIIINISNIIDSTDNLIDQIKIHLLLLLTNMKSTEIDVCTKKSSA
jgi:hypothetical protein